jgi:hypothetical protein
VLTAADWYLGSPFMGVSGATCLESDNCSLIDTALLRICGAIDLKGFFIFYFLAIVSLNLFDTGFSMKKNLDLDGEF